jgi:hypothetical protein
MDNLTNHLSVDSSILVPPVHRFLQLFSDLKQLMDTYTLIVFEVFTSVSESFKASQDAQHGPSFSYTISSILCVFVAAFLRLKQSSFAAHDNKKKDVT